PKCGYLGFEQVDRCRNCQYDFSLHAPAPEPDFAIRRETETGNLQDDLPLIDAASVWTASRAMINVEADLDRVFGAEEPEPQRAAVAPMSLAAVANLPRGLPREELPLFGPPIPDDEPLITKASPPRQPLAVRRATPEAPKARPEPLGAPILDLAIDPEGAPPPVVAAPTPPSRPGRSPWSAADGHALAA